ncbi:hypothetical protein L6164_013087 [Bauhinia variegata]|uniref:Uncharacterized protein n=1 Tax=Bauhinia variegata TaxID=167791 RepID=A0ACB9PB06_BAUVA|nr:hypothetical protein L6164_013087 [Bauhinia variegata]
MLHAQLSKGRDEREKKDKDLEHFHLSKALLQRSEQRYAICALKINHFWVLLRVLYHPKFPGPLIKKVNQ